MQPFRGDGLQTLPPDSVAWRHKHTNCCPKEIFEIFPTFSHSPRKVICADELEKTIFFIVVIAVKHGLVATCSNTRSKVID